MNKIMKVFIIAIALMGVIRFILSVNGVPNQTTKYFSMTAIMIVGLIYFAITKTTHMERLKAAYLLVIPYLTVEVLALGFTWATGRQTIFHAAEYSLGTSIPVHTIGHLVGGLTWEPLIIFLIMEVIWGVYAGSRSLLGSKAAA
jgi:hypothetical protein